MTTRIAFDAINLTLGTTSADKVNKLGRKSLTKHAVSYQVPFKNIRYNCAHLNIKNKCTSVIWLQFNDLHLPYMHQYFYDISFYK